jgi:hypothetical protein
LLLLSGVRGLVIFYWGSLLSCGIFCRNVVLHVIRWLGLDRRRFSRWLLRRSRVRRGGGGCESQHRGYQPVVDA